MFICVISFTAAYVNAGQVLTRLGRIANAREMYTTCLSISDDGIKDLRNHLEAKTSAYLRLGKLLVEDEDDLRAAIGIYRQAVKLMPSDYSQKQVKIQVVWLFFSIFEFVCKWVL